MRRTNPLSELESYDPAPLLDALYAALSVNQDADLAKALGVSRSLVSKLRSKNVVVTAEILLKMHDASGLDIRDLRKLMGDNRRIFSDMPPSRFTKVT